MDHDAMLTICHGIVEEMDAIRGECDRLIEHLSAADEQASDDDVEALLFDSAQKQVREAKFALSQARAVLEQYVGASVLARK